MMTLTLPKVLAVALAGLALTGCAEAPFDANGAAAQIQSKPLELDGEQVILTSEHVACGEREDLWVVFEQGGGRSVARLNESGRKLGFTDDIHIGDPGIHFPYAQIRGSFPVQPTGPRLKDFDEKTKMLESKIGVVMDHPCLQNPLPVLMGLRHGQYSASETPNFRFRLRGENWEFDQLVH